MGCFGRRGKKYQCTIVLLDETDIVEVIEHNTKGEVLLDKVYKHLNLLETAYFGLRFLNKNGESRWLDPLMKISKQLKGVSPITLYFGVKFYASDPCKLLEEITRYQFVLQLKQDILQGRLPLANDLAAELFALSLQAELGDFDPRKHHKLYVSEFRFCPNQGQEMEERVEQIHKTLAGKVPSAVEMTFLEKVKWLDMYGIDLHRVLGDDHVEYFLGLTPSGVVVMKNKKKMSNYFWPRISKVFFKGKYFMIRVRDKANDEMTYGFLLSTRDSCEYLWKCCVEHHAFFRLTQVKDISGNPMQIFRLGSKYRYSGRTEQQVRNEIKKIKRSPPPIIRVPSRRFQKRLGEPDGADAETLAKENLKNILRNTKDDLSVVQVVESTTLYRSVSTPAGLSAVEQNQTNDVNPWEDPNQRGLFSSRLSLTSSRGSEKRSGHRSHHRRSSSIDSQTSTDSRHRRRHHRCKRSSDNESEISKSSRGSRSSRNGSSHRKMRSHHRESGSESDSHHRSRRRKHSSKRNDNKYHLVESESQWKQIQKQQQEKEQARLQNAVVRDLSNRKSGYMNSGVETESEAPIQRRKKHRRHSRSRSRSRSPDGNPVISQEVKKHLQYRLIDPVNLTEEEKRDIKYTKVQTETNGFKIRYSPTTGRPRYKVSKMSSRTSLDTLSKRSTCEEDPPPPYTINLIPCVRMQDAEVNSNGICQSNLVKLGNNKSISKGNPKEMKRNNPRKEALQHIDTSRKYEDTCKKRKKSDLVNTKSKGKHEISTEL